MSFTYKPLWKLLIDKDMSKKYLMNAANISKSTMDKMGRSEIVSLEIIDRICNYFNCKVEDVIEHNLEKGRKPNAK
ncbi:helix-turn-helix domain-containing protein [Anaerotignum lactatifermentans]|uniref:helix-turn-helix domain-containing protein n=1 Tax=Anaerotignum lactatifermentans TaxID=160404 RepID=UPI0018737FB6|nr:helix-turn-helix transcriptional regulator [Anaerotignum lactatifermentans]MBE5076473.1 helix-turn-helix transcriptional regulator [Anaerotignum lactatifermentans]